MTVPLDPLQVDIEEVMNTLRRLLGQMDSDLPILEVHRTIMEQFCILEEEVEGDIALDIMSDQETQVLIGHQPTSLLLASQSSKFSRNKTYRGSTAHAIIGVPLSNVKK